MRDPVTKEILGATYTYRPMPTSKGVRALQLLARIGLPSLGAISGSDVSGLLGALGTAVGQLADSDRDWLLATLAEGTRVDTGGGVGFVGLKSVYDDHFAGHYESLVQWLRWCLEVEYGPLVASLAPAAVVPPATG